MILHRMIPALLATVVAGLLCATTEAGAGAERPRVIISTDIGGGDPDDHQSMVHYLVYADRFVTEGLISSPPRAGRVKDIFDCLDAYEQDFANLRTWSADYPSPRALRAVARQGAIDSQAGATPDALSAGAKLLVERARLRDPRPLYVLVWGSITDVAQAVHAAPDIKPRLRVYSIGSWNTRNGVKERDYLFSNHPDLWWIENDTTFRGMYMGGNQEGDLSNKTFPEQHVRGHGALGGLFMLKKADIKMGDSPSVLYLLDGDPDQPGTPHWGGAFIQPQPVERQNYWHDNPAKDLVFNGKAGAVTVNQWRPEYLSDWQARMIRAQTSKSSTP